MSVIIKQGKQYLIDKKKTYKYVEPSLDLIEGFDGQKQGDAIKKINKVEMKKLEDMQNSYNTLMSKWGDQYKTVLNHIKNPQMKNCVKHCLTENNLDKRSACYLGCSTGQFANSSVDQRITDPNPPPSWNDIIEPALMASVFTMFMGVTPEMIMEEEHDEYDITATNKPAANSTLVENFEGMENKKTDEEKSTDAARAVTDSDLGLETSSPGGFNVKTGATVNAPKTYWSGVEFDLGIPDSIMGTYGPDGYDGIGKKATGDMINRYLASNPGYGENYYFDKTTGKGGKVIEEKDSYGYKTNIVGIRSLGTSSVDVLIKDMTQNFSSQPLVKQMEITNINKDILETYLYEMRTVWKNMLSASCKAGIGGFGKTGPFNTVDTKKFAGNTQYCSAWVNTAENRSGYYSYKKGEQPFTADLGGNKLDFKKKTIGLSNLKPNGCNTPIPGTRPNDLFVGGAGYCICEDGSKHYADAGHPTFNCNDACAQGKGGASLLYHNTKKWTPPKGLSYGKWQIGVPLVVGTIEEDFKRPGANLDDCNRKYGSKGNPSTLKRNTNNPELGDVCVGGNAGLNNNKNAPSDCWDNSKQSINERNGIFGIQGKGKYKCPYGTCAYAETAADYISPKPCRIISDRDKRIKKNKNYTTGSTCGTMKQDVQVLDEHGWGFGYYNKSKYTYKPIKDTVSCPTGMVVEEGYPKLTEKCGAVNFTQVLEGNRNNSTTANDKVKGWENRCVYAKPAGYDKPMVNNISKIKPLPTPDELHESCASVPFESAYIDILELNLLGYLLQQKAAIIYKTIKESYSGSKATALKSSMTGKKILQNIKLYERAYKDLQSQKNKRGLMSALAEDISLKNTSTNISYYLWLTLAIGGTAFAISKFNS